MKTMEIEDLYRVIPLKPLRKTEGVSFDVLPRKAVPKIDALDRVMHAGGAVSPGPVGEVSRPWYMHPAQADNLMVFCGVRYVDIYTKAHGRVEHFTVAPDLVKHNDEVLYEGAAMLVWPRGVFHRIRSDAELGSASLNLAVHYEGWDVKTNFNVYDLDSETGEYELSREGFLDQPGGSEEGKI